MTVRIGERMVEFFADESRWVQGEYHVGERYCLAGAYGFLLHKDPYFLVFNGVPSVYVKRMVFAIGEQFPDRVVVPVRITEPDAARDVIEEFNDHRETSFGDVQMVLVKAAEV